MAHEMSTPRDDLAVSRKRQACLPASQHDLITRRHDEALAIRFYRDLSGYSWQVRVRWAAHATDDDGAAAVPVLEREHDVMAQV
jgi:hypothetical protein